MGESARRTTMSHGGTPGFTLVEVTNTLLVLTTLRRIMLPQMGNFNRLARFTKAREDLALCAVAKTMLDAVWRSTFYDDPAGDCWAQNPAFPVGLLVGAGPLGQPLHDQHVRAVRGGEGTFTSPVLCYSAGANERVDTPFNFPGGTGYELGTGEVAVIVSAGGAS